MATLGKILSLVKASTTRPTKLMGVSNSSLARLMGVGLGVQATGGTITYSGSYTIHKFTANGTFTVNTGGGQSSGDVEYLVVGGGDGGGGGGVVIVTGGGGGAGGYLAGTGHAVTPQAYPITVGAGGSGAIGGLPTTPGTNGADTVFDTKTAIGGGRGGAYYTFPPPPYEDAFVPNTGGSGGGGALGDAGAAGTSGPPIQGYAGGAGTGTDPDPASGGGGGSSGVGTDGVYSANRTDGGPGTANSISGAAVTYAAGGKGASRLTVYDDRNGANGADNTGDGGDGGGVSPSAANGGSGGSGIVIVRYT